MKKIILITAFITLSACAHKTANTFEKRVSVPYFCGAHGETMLTADYTIHNGNIVNAQIHMNNIQTQPMAYQPHPNHEENRFISENGWEWITDYTTADKLPETDGNMLTRHATITMNGKAYDVTEIVVKYCTVRRHKH